MVSEVRVKASDVAAAAGVSVATVSYVLNNTPGQRISSATAERVRGAAARLGYVRNRTAQSLARGDSRIVVIDRSALPNGPVSEAGAHQFNSRIESLGYTAIQSWWEYAHSSDHLPKLVETVGATRVLTAVTLPSHTRAVLQNLGVKTMSSLIDTETGMKGALENSGVAQVEYLAAKGHTNLLYALGFSRLPEFFIRLHENAARTRAHQLGLTWNVTAPSTSLDAMCGCMTDALQRFPDATAMVTVNDGVALQALSAAAAAGVRVPEDMAIIGTGNFDFSAYTYPTLTTVAYNYNLELLPADVFELMLEGTGVEGISSRFGQGISTDIIARGSA